MPAPRMSSSAIPNAAPIMARPTPWCTPRREAAWRAGLVAIICIGETRAEREVGATLDVLSRQIAGSVAGDGHGRQHRRRL